MVVCSCRGVTERRILAEIERGAATVAEVASRCGAGRDCGSCVPDLVELIAGSATERQAHPSNPNEPPGEAQRGFP